MKNAISLLFITLILSFVKVNGQQSLDVDNIPVELLEGANSVVRYDETSFEIQSIGKGIYKNKTAITILNSNAQNEAKLSYLYDKLTTIKNINSVGRDPDSRPSVSRGRKYEDRPNPAGYWHDAGWDEQRSH